MKLRQLWHPILCSHTVMTKDGIGQIIICAHRWRSRRWHAYFQTEGTGDWREIDEDELVVIANS